MLHSNFYTLCYLSCLIALLYSSQFMLNILHFIMCYTAYVIYYMYVI